MEQTRISEDSSILIVVGRKDTGDLEAQIRGSRYGWDFRLISVDSLMKLVQIKANLTDEKTIRQISEILRPLEFTRLDKLIEIIFDTTQDVQIEQEEELSTDIPNDDEKYPTLLTEKRLRTSPVNFQENCVKKVEEYLKVNLVKTTRSGYATPTKDIGFLCCISKPHKQKLGAKYWFGFHDHQREFLFQFKKSYVIYGCGSQEHTFLIPFDLLEQKIEYLWKTDKKSGLYWHIVIHHRNNQFEWQVPQLEENINLATYRIP